MKKIALFVFTATLLASCEKQVDWTVQSEQHNVLVVDGMLTNVMKAHSIKLSHTVSQLNEVSQAASGAKISVSDGDSTLHLTETPAGSGIYLTDPTFIGTPGKTYTLFISYNGKDYSAETTMLPGQSFNELQYAKNTGNNLYHITWVADVYNAQNFAMYEINLDWSAVPGYESYNPDSCKAKLFYYTLPTIDVSQVFTPTLENVSFPAGTQITEYRYSITTEHAQFIRALLSETKWQGGYFDSSHSNLPTNISEGGCGFFSACGVEVIYSVVSPI
jgi:hypothetical protein